MMGNCDLLEEIFDLQAQTVEEEEEEHNINVGIACKLRSLDIRNLPSLKYVWNGDPQGINISFHNLHKVYAWNCPSLKSLFPFSFAHQDLQQLEVLNIDGCGVEVLVKEGRAEKNPKFMFPQLKSLTLWRSERLKCFYSETHILECPYLESLSVFGCENLKIFNSDSQEFQEVLLDREKEESPQKSEVAQPLFLFRKIIRNLEVLTLDYADFTRIQESQFLVDSFLKLRSLQLQGFSEDSGKFLFDFLQKFKKLESLVLRKCYFSVLLPHGIVGETLAQIQFLRLDYLPNMRHIWNQDCCQLLSKLQTLEILGCYGLINLAPYSASFQNLSILVIKNCHRLVNLVSSSTAQCMANLTNMSISYCDMVAEIIAKEENESQFQSKTELIFHKLASLRLHCLKSLTSFCSSASHIIKFPSLEEAVVMQCPMMKVFSQEVSAPKLKRVYLTEEGDKWRWTGDLNTTVKQLYSEMRGLNGLHYLKLSEIPELKEVWHGQVPVNFFHNLSTLVVDVYAYSTCAVPSNLLSFLNNLEELEVRNCSTVEQIFGVTEWQNDIGFVGHLSKLNNLQLIDLPRLRLLWNETPKQSFDFKNLKILEVHRCSRLKYIFTPAVCSGLVQLQELTVRSCEMVKEIITEGLDREKRSEEIKFPLLNSVTLERLPSLINFCSRNVIVQCPSLKEIIIAECPTKFICMLFSGGAELNENHGIIKKKIVFPNLTDLKLSAVQIEQILYDRHLQDPSCYHNLTSLIVDGCSNLKYLFSSSMVKSIVHLKKLDICDCKMMEEIIFCEGLGKEMISEMLLSELDFLKLRDLPKVAHFCTCDSIEFPALKELSVQNCPQLRTFVCHSTSANADIVKCALFDEKVACPSLKIMQIIKMDNLKMIWGNQLHPYSFCKLKRLSTTDGKGLLKLFPSSMVGRLQNLKHLNVENCDSLEVVFDLQQLIVGNSKEANQLKTLVVSNLRNLKLIWNKDLSGDLSFPNLCTVNAWKCPNLKYLFPASMAEGLPNLETIDIFRCGMEEIVAKGSTEATHKFVFPRLQSLVLKELKNLECFYRGIHSLESPRLECLKVHECGNFETFAQQPQNLEQLQMEGEGQLEIQVQPLFSFDKVIPSLEALGLRSKDIKMIEKGQFLDGPFNRVKELELQCFHDHDDLSSFPFHILPKFPEMEKLVVNCCDFTELFLDKLLIEEKQAASLAQIRSLKLRSLPRLLSISNQKSQVLGNIENLQVLRCKSLVSLAPSVVSFSNLTTLFVWKCHGLVKLVTSPTAKSLVHLAEMEVSECKMVREIITNEEGEPQTEIALNKLVTLTLKSLTSLTVFSSETCTLKFPSLEEVIVTQCPEMNTFSRGVVSAPKLQKVHLTLDKEKWRWIKDLNTTLHQLYTETNPQTTAEE